MERKYLIFSLLDEFFGIPISEVREIIRHEKITPIHDAVPCVRGVINLRGMIITIFDTRERFGLDFKPYDKHTVFIICEVLTKSNQPFLVGMAVDAVHQVEVIADGEVKHAQDLGLSISSEYLQGIVHGKQGLTQLLDINRVVNEKHHPRVPETGDSEAIVTP